MDLLRRIDEIPTLPVVANQVNELIANPKSNTADIAQVLRRDQALSAKVLKLINSPYYSIPGGVSDVQRALGFLGFNTLAQLVLSVSVFSVFKNESTDEFPLSQFWKHALATAVSAEIIAKHLKYPNPAECFTCGLLHDVGKIALYQIDRNLFLEIIRNAKVKQITFHASEQELKITSHTEIGESIAKRWKLPSVICKVIRSHHDDLSNYSKKLDKVDPIVIVSLANHIASYLQLGHSGNYVENKRAKNQKEDQASLHLMDKAASILNLSEASIESIKLEVQEEMLRAGSFLTLGG